MECEEYEFAKEFNQIITGVNRYLKNKQNHNHNRLAEHLLSIVRTTQTSNTQPVPHLQNENSIQRTSSRQRLGLVLRESPSLALMKVYTSRQKFKKMNRIHQNQLANLHENSQCCDLLEQKKTDITELSPQATTDGNNHTNYPQVSRSKRQNTRLKELLHQKSLNYQQMKQQKKIFEERQKNIQKEQINRLKEQKQKVSQQREEGRRKQEDYYFNHLERIYHQKSEQRVRKLRMTEKKHQQIISLQKQQYQQIELFEKSLLIQDQIRSLIQKQAHQIGSPIKQPQRRCDTYQTNETSMF